MITGNVKTLRGLTKVVISQPSRSPLISDTNPSGLRIQIDGTMESDGVSAFPLSISIARRILGRSKYILTKGVNPCDPSLCEQKMRYKTIGD